MSDDDQEEGGWERPIDEEQVDQATDQAVDMLVKLSRPFLRKGLRKVIVVSKQIEDYVREAWQQD